jgi:hypothetical protein
MITGGVCPQTLLNLPKTPKYIALSHDQLRPAHLQQPCDSLTTHYATVPLAGEGASVLGVKLELGSMFDFER